MKKLGIFGLTLVCSLFLTAGVASAATIIVPTNQPTIQDAVNAASNGDVIKVLAGTYNENVLVNKEVEILGAGKLKTFVFATSALSNAFDITADNVTISHFTIRGGTSGLGVFIEASSAKVTHCIVEKSAFGIGINQGSGSKIHNNQIRYNTASGGFPTGTGIIVVSGGSDILDTVIANNQINDNDEFGIFVWGRLGNPSFDGTKLLHNVLLDNGAQDLSAPSNNNNLGFGFINVIGTITMNGNKIWATATPGNEITVSGGSATFVGSGNLIFPGSRGQLYGHSSPLALP